MGGCSSKETTAEPAFDSACRPSASSNAAPRAHGQRPSSNRHCPKGNQQQRRPSAGRNRQQHQRSAKSRSDTSTPGPSRTSGTSLSSNMSSGAVYFAEFKDREKNVVHSVLENNRHLSMAAIKFDDLKLQKIIGTGAFGEVIKGTYCGTPVVVKRMLRNKIDENHLRMFGEEIQLMMNLRHPNIVQFIGASWNSYSNVCFVTEFLERGDLFSILRNPKYVLTYTDPILRMMIDTSRGMAYLHSMKPPIIHRDLKSMNILVNSTFGCKVSDFGLSREKSVDETMSVTGTPLWLPPEMIRGERYTENADVYSFGIVVSEFDTRKVPYHDIKAKGARHKKVSGSTLMHMVAYEKLRPTLSSNCLLTIKSLYERCTSDDAQSRPTFEEIVAELDGPVRDEIVRASHGIKEITPEQQDTSAEELGVTHATKYTDN